MYVCYINQIGATIGNQIKLPLVKVSHASEDFIAILERLSLFFYEQKHSYITLACLVFANIIKMPFGLSCVRSFQWLCTPIQKGKKILTRVERGTMIVKKLGGSSNWSPLN